MDEHDRGSRGVLAWALIVLAVFTLIAAYWSRPRTSAARPGISWMRLPAGPAVELWLSTADRRLRLARQPDIAITAPAADSADVVIDLHQTYQSIVGFGAALTDASAWLIQHKLDERQRSALLRELFGPPPGLDLNMTRLTIGASDFSLQQYTPALLPRRRRGGRRRAQTPGEPRPDAPARRRGRHHARAPWVSPTAARAGYWPGH